MSWEESNVPHTRTYKAKGYLQSLKTHNNKTWNNNSFRWLRKSLTHCILVTYAWRRNPWWRAATESVRSVLFPLRYRVAQANSKSQPDGFRATGGGDEGECVGVPLSQSLCWCPAVSLAPSAWSSPAAAASFPGTEPSSLRPLLYSDLDRGDSRGRGGREDKVSDSCDIFWILKKRFIAPSPLVFFHLIHLFPGFLPLNKRS